MAATAPTTLYCTQQDVEAILSTDGVQLRLDDDQSGVTDSAESAYMTQYIGWATARLNMYLMGRYDAADLAQSYAVNEFAAIMVAQRICRRRGNPAANSIQELYEESIELLKQIKAGVMGLEDVAERTSGAPFWDNIRHTRHALRRTRVERPISEQTQRQQPSVTVDDQSANYVGPEIW